MCYRFSVIDVILIIRGHPTRPPSMKTVNTYEYATATLSLNMGRRDRLISSSILRAIFQTGSKQHDEEARPGFFARIIAFFAIFSLALSRYRGRLFKKLRGETWEMEEEEYTESFRSPSKNKRTDLVAVGDLGYSGSVCSMQNKHEP
jgi:hypothetical protein